MQYREELERVAMELLTEKENKRIALLNQIQTHAINQIKDGYTSFRISRLKKEDEKYLREWAEITNANVEVIKFRCFENARRYIIRQYLVDFKNNVKSDCLVEGKTLIL